jgi:hypothetical protein
MRVAAGDLDDVYSEPVEESLQLGNILDVKTPTTDPK